MYTELDVPDKKGNKARTAHQLKEREFGEESPLLERERNLNTKDVNYILDLFWDLHLIRGASQPGTVPAIDPLRLKAHVELAGIDLSQWEYRLIMEMDLTYRGGVMQKWE